MEGPKWVQVISKGTVSSDIFNVICSPKTYRINQSPLYIIVMYLVSSVCVLSLIVYTVLCYVVISSVTSLRECSLQLSSIVLCACVFVYNLCMPMGLTGPELGAFFWLPGPPLDDDAGADSGSDMSYDSIGSHSSLTGQFPWQP